VPIELRDKIFERFWRGESDKEGAGLGLAIVRRIMQALHGTVTVSDAPEGGAAFTLQFEKCGTPQQAVATQSIAAE